MIKKIVENTLIKILKILKVDLLAHAHVQIGVGHNTYSSGESYVIDTVIPKALKKQPQLIFDVGANDGSYAQQLSNKFPQCEIICFEPSPNNFEKLLEKTKNLNVIRVNSAVGSEKGTLVLSRGSRDEKGEMYTYYPETLNQVLNFVGDINETISCEVTTISDYLGNSTKVIDFLKIDVEGHEIEVLKGTKVLLQENRVLIIQFEFNEFNLFSGGTMIGFYQLLEGYDLYRIMPKNKLFALGSYTSAHEIYRYQNILAVHKTLDFKHDEN